MNWLSPLEFLGKTPKPHEATRGLSSGLQPSFFPEAGGLGPLSRHFLSTKYNMSTSETALGEVLSFAEISALLDQLPPEQRGPVLQQHIEKLYQRALQQSEARALLERGEREASVLREHEEREARALRERKERQVQASRYEADAARDREEREAERERRREELDKLRAENMRNLADLKRAADERVNVKSWCDVLVSSVRMSVRRLSTHE